MKALFARSKQSCKLTGQHDRVNGQARSMNSGVNFLRTEFQTTSHRGNELWTKEQPTRSWCISLPHQKKKHFQKCNDQEEWTWHKKSEWVILMKRRCSEPRRNCATQRSDTSSRRWAPLKRNRRYAGMQRAENYGRPSFKGLALSLTTSRVPLSM